MGIFIAGRTTCPICARPIARWLDATQLPYVSPDDLGETAKWGRPFVHRDCWATWPRRAAWTASAARLAANAPDARTTRSGMVVLTLTGYGGLLEDTHHAFRIMLKVSDAEPLLRALHATTPATVFMDGTTWTVSPSGPTLATHVDADDVFEVVLDNVDDWVAVLAASARFPNARRRERPTRDARASTSNARQSARLADDAAWVRAETRARNNVMLTQDMRQRTRLRVRS